MAYIAPFISAAGLVIPSYADILSDLITQYRSIYGQSIYLGTDSADYQMISIFALKTADTMAAVQLAYNARSPLTAVGADLDSIVKMNGMSRNLATFSTAPGLVSGIANTSIQNGSVTDQQGNIWVLPTEVIIPSGGSVTVVLQCLTAGAVTAAANTITQISGGATAGWNAITNTSPASPGLPVEADSQLRGRQAFSVAIPSKTLLQGTLARLAATPGVTRVIVHENFTGSVDADGTPPHSISAVVEGGDNTAIATQIFTNRGIGPDMNGTITIPIPNGAGDVTEVSFSRPTYQSIFVSITIIQLAGYSSNAATLMVTAITTYLNSLAIGQAVIASVVEAVAMSVMPSFIVPQFAIEAITIGIAPSPGSDIDIPMNYNQVAQSQASFIVVTGG